MNQKLYVLHYINDKQGWNLKEEQILAYKEYPTYYSIVLDRGILGGPHFHVVKEALEDWLSQVEEAQEEEPVGVAIFTQIPGITEEIQEGLYHIGVYNYLDLNQVAMTDEAKLLEIKGLGPAKLQKIKDYLLVKG